MSNKFYLLIAIFLSLFFLVGCRTLITPHTLAFQPLPYVNESPKGLPMINSTTMEQILFTKVNDKRLEQKLPLLHWDKQLATIARAHSLDMAKRSFFDHGNPEGFGPIQRLEAGGFHAFKNSSENLFVTSLVAQYGVDEDKKCVSEAVYRSQQDMIESAFRIWQRENGSRAALFKPEFDASAIGVVTLDDKLYYFTQLFIEPTRCGVKGLPCCNIVRNDAPVQMCSEPADCTQQGICVVDPYYEQKIEPYTPDPTPSFRPELPDCK